MGKQVDSKSTVTMEEQYKLGCDYLEGKGVQKNVSEAIKLLTMAAEQGHINAMAKLSDLYEDDNLGVNDDKKCVDWTRKAAEKGHAGAQNSMGVIYNYGIRGVTQDFKQAIHWFNLAIQQNYPNAFMGLGAMHEEGNGVEQSYKKAMKYWLKGAELGDKAAQTSVGNLYLNGKGVERDIDKAIYWYTLAAEQGYNVAEMSLGTTYNYRNANGDKEKAFYWYQKAAEQGHTDAQLSLADCYEQGKGVEKDKGKAIELYQKAAEKGNTTAMNCLGDIYYSQNSEYWDYEKAFEWYIKAVKGNSYYVIYNLSKCFFYGHGVEQNYEVAFYWLKNSVEKGYVPTKLDLAKHYFYGLGTNQDFTSAKDIFVKFHEGRASLVANYYVGLMYEEGRGVKQDLEKARVAYYAASKNYGIRLAQYKYEKLSKCIYDNQQFEFDGLQGQLRKGQALTNEQKRLLTFGTLILGISPLTEEMNCEKHNRLEVSEFAHDIRMNVLHDKWKINNRKDALKTLDKLLNESHSPLADEFYNVYGKKCLDGKLTVEDVARDLDKLPNHYKDAAGDLEFILMDSIMEHVHYEDSIDAVGTIDSDGMEMMNNLANNNHMKPILNEIKKNINNVMSAYKNDYKMLIGLGYTKNELETVTPVLACDYSQVINAARWCYTAEYITEDEAWQYIKAAAERAEKVYGSWREFLAGYVLGRAIRYNRDSTDCRHYFEYLLNHKDSPYKHNKF